MEERTYCVYMHANKINGKKYVGQTCREPEKRWGKNGCEYDQSPYFYNAILKYGWDNFFHEILFTGLTHEQANKMESCLINFYKSNNKKFGYNIRGGGSNGALSEETKRKISEANRGKKLSPEQVKAMSERFKGKNNPNYGNHKLAGKNNPNYGKHWNAGENNYFYGKKHTQETIEYLRKINTGKKHSAESIEKMRKAQKGRQAGVLHPQIKPILQFDKNGNFIREWQYINQARDCLGIDPSTIVRCCKGRQQTASGYIWKYK
jgi:group I intron endonuclease